MANTYVAISTVTVGSGGAANISFTSITSDYTDLLIKTSFRSTDTSFAEGRYANISFNSSTSNFTVRILEAYNGNNVISGTTPARTIATFGGSSGTVSTFSNGEIYIPNYKTSNYKSYSVDTASEQNSTTHNDLQLIGGLWSDTAAITSITMTPDSSNFAQYTTATLYGIKSS